MGFTITFTTSAAAKVACGVGLAVIAFKALMKRRHDPETGRWLMKPAENTTRPVLYTFPRWTLGPNPSPACVAAETFLRIAKIPHDVDVSVKQGPTERWPYMAYRGEYICDTNTMIERLVKDTNFRGDDNLTNADKAKGWAVLRMFEQGTYFCIVRHRWVDNIAHYIDKMCFVRLPDFLKRPLMGSIMRNMMIKMLNSQGCGDRTDPEYRNDTLKDVQAFERMLDSNGFFFDPARAPEPTTFDAIFFAYMHSLAVFDVSCAEKPDSCKPWAVVDYIRKSDKIKRFLSRMEKAAFPDMASVTHRLDGKKESWDPDVI